MLTCGFGFSMKVTALMFLLLQIAASSQLMPSFSLALVNFTSYQLNVNFIRKEKRQRLTNYVYITGYGITSVEEHDKAIEKPEGWSENNLNQRSSRPSHSGLPSVYIFIMVAI